MLSDTDTAVFGKGFLLALAVIACFILANIFDIGGAGSFTVENGLTDLTTSIFGDFIGDALDTDNFLAKVKSGKN